MEKENVLVPSAPLRLNAQCALRRVCLHRYKLLILLTSVIGKDETRNDNETTCSGTDASYMRKLEMEERATMIDKRD